MGDHRQDESGEANPTIFAVMGIFSLMGIVYNALRIAYALPDYPKGNLISIGFFVICLVSSVWKVSKS